MSSSEVSMTINMGMTAIQRKIPKWLPFKNYNSKTITKNVMIIY